MPIMLTMRERVAALAALRKGEALGDTRCRVVKLAQVLDNTAAALKLRSTVHIVQTRLEGRRWRLEGR